MFHSTNLTTIDVNRNANIESDTRQGTMKKFWKSANQNVAIGYHSVSDPPHSNILQVYLINLSKTGYSSQICWFHAVLSDNI